MPKWSEDAYLSEKLAKDLYKPCGCGEQFPRAWATFTIDMSLMSNEQRAKVYEAQTLLREAGVTFDTGAGMGGRDWELDWCLVGAKISVRPIRCMDLDCNKLITRGKAFFAVYRRQSDGWTPTYSYCCPAHQKRDNKGEGMTVLYTAWQEVGLKGDPWYSPLKRLWKWFRPKKKQDPVKQDPSKEE